MLASRADLSSVDMRWPNVVEIVVECWRRRMAHLMGSEHPSLAGTVARMRLWACKGPRPSRAAHGAAVDGYEPFICTMGIELMQ